MTEDDDVTKPKISDSKTNGFGSNGHVNGGAGDNHHMPTESQDKSFDEAF